MEIALDVRATLTIWNVFSQVVKRFGLVDILVNNAGIQLLKPAVEIEESEYDEIMAVNLKGPFLCSQAAAAVMIGQRSGCIVNVASQHGVVGNRLRAAYCASKGGLVNLTRALAVEWAEYNIRVNSISPTFVSNERNPAMLDTADVREQVERMPLKRVATPEDIAAGICYLASPGGDGDGTEPDGGWRVDRAVMRLRAGAASV